MIQQRAFAAVLLFGLVAVACGDSVSSPGDYGGGATTSPEMTVGPLTVPEARAAADGRMQVSGSILQAAIQQECDADGTCADEVYELHLCGAMTRSIPPKCVGDFFYLRGLDPASLEFQEAPDGTGWTAPILVTGRKQGEAFISEAIGAS